MDHLVSEKWYRGNAQSPVLTMQCSGHDWTKPRGNEEIAHVLSSRPAGDVRAAVALASVGGWANRRGRSGHVISSANRWHGLLSRHCCRVSRTFSDKRRKTSRQQRPPFYVSRYSCGAEHLAIAFPERISVAGAAAAPVPIRAIAFAYSRP